MTEPIKYGTIISNKKTWSIAEVEQETGLGKDTLRVWERRYGFPLPDRDANGERLYPADQVQRLRLIRRLINLGHRPREIVSQPIEKLTLITKAESEKRNDSNEQIESETLLPQVENPETWLEWLKQDQSDLMRQKLQHVVLSKGLAHLVDDYIAPLCVFVGQAWIRGELSVYQEHLFTEVVKSVMRESVAALDAVSPADLSGKRPRVLLTTTANEHHLLGLRMVECYLAISNCPRFVLGASTPTSDILQAADRLQADVIALSFSSFASRQSILHSIADLRGQLPQTVDLWVGGAGLSSLDKSLPYGVRLMSKPSDIFDAVKAWTDD